MKHVSSRHNPIVQRFRALADRPDPSGAQLLLDGVHLVRDARRAGLGLEVVAIVDTQAGTDSESGRLAQAAADAGAEVVMVGERVLKALSPVTHPSGIVAIGARTPHALADLAVPEALVVVAVDVQDPGNLGALARAAEAAGATGFAAAGASANPFAWKALRGSMGSLLRLPVVGGLDVAEAVSSLHAAGLRIIAAVARGGHDPDEVDWQHACALLVGGEGHGLQPPIVDHAHEAVTVPMQPAVESLNVAVAGGILCYAARRQRTARPLGHPS